ncbi:unnamed protein product [Caenorhabditis angaria]|uniref:PDZ domain-containing protein n=1 Tax=Caenorhabditis angaria TaxID=860376 RepID=A0A9P1IE76_9PELO|nr:unnamed protein product [Caenorhabditis angaria]
MTYETISVRMNRSDRNIRWGFTVRQQADGLVIDRIEPDSLSDKAGVKHNDKIEQINGRQTRGLDANTANRLIDDSFNEVRLSLQRFVTSHTCLPWTLNEKDNKMVVEDMKPGFGNGFGHNFNNGSTNYSNNNFGNNHFNQNSSSAYKTSSTTQNNSQSSTYHSSSSSNKNGHVIPTTLIGNNTFSNNYRAPFGNGFDNHITSTRNYINQSPNNYNSTPAAFHESNNNNHYSTSKSTAPFSSNQNNGGDRFYNHHVQTKPVSPIPPPSTYSYNNGGSSQQYGNGSGGTPLNQQTFINTNNLSNYSGAVSPGGKTYYHSPSTRNHNDLSPGASIHHLQYNSPMNLYSSESAAEQYFQQTGKSPEGPVPHDKTPAYLTSEARKLIEEEARGRNSRGKSPSSQSSCFKRISHAVGADN